MVYELRTSAAVGMYNHRWEQNQWEQLITNEDIDTLMLDDIIYIRSRLRGRSTHLHATVAFRLACCLLAQPAFGLEWCFSDFMRTMVFWAVTGNYVQYMNLLQSPRYQLQFSRYRLTRKSTKASSCSVGRTEDVCWNCIHATILQL